MKTGKKKVAGQGAILMLLLSMQVPTVSLAESKDKFDAICGDTLGAAIPAASGAAATGAAFVPGVNIVTAVIVNGLAGFYGGLAGRHADEWCAKIKKKVERPPKQENHLLSCDAPAPVPPVVCDPNRHLKKKSTRR